MIDINRAGIWMRVAKEIATMSTCPRREVGAVILNDLGHVLATGFNGVPSGFKSCFLDACPGSLSLPGEHLDRCIAIHAEMNAMMQLRTPREASALFTTSSPCKHCIKMLLNTEIKTIFYDELYDGEALEMWKQAGREAIDV